MIWHPLNAGVGEYNVKAAAQSGQLPAGIAQAERQGGIGFLCCADHLGGGVHPQHIGLGVAVRQLSGAVPGPAANVNHFGRIFVGNAAEQILRRACPLPFKA